MSRYWHSIIGTAGLALVLLMPAQGASGATCSRRMGPYDSQYTANQEIQRARNAGYQTSGTWGEGGMVSQSSNRRLLLQRFSSMLT